MTTPIPGPALIKTLAAQRPAPKAESPTGPPYLPTKWVRPVMGLYLSLAGLAGYLAVFTDNEQAKKVGFGIGAVLAILGPLLGIASPGWRKLAALVVVAGASILASPTWASSRAMVEFPVSGSALDDGRSEFGDLLDVATGPSIDCRAGQCSLGVTALGTVALVDLGRFTLSAAMGGGVLLPDSGPAGVGQLGVTLQFPGQTVRAALGVGATYHLPTADLPAGWGAWGALLFHL